MCAVAVTKKIEIAEREKKNIIRVIIGGVLYRFLFIFWGAAADWDGQLHHYRDFRAGGILHLTFCGVDWPESRRGQWQGKERRGGW